MTDELKDIELKFRRLSASISDEIPAPLYLHSLGVARTAAGYLLAEDKKSAVGAYQAGLLHDIAKPLPPEELLRLCGDFGILITSIERSSHWLLHAKAGAEIARIKFGVADPEILEAIRWHTVGKPGLSKVGLAVYLADAAEPGREFPGVERIRAAADVSLIQGCVAAVNASLFYVIERGWMIDPASVEFRNWLLDQESGSTG
ncbi:MAG: HD domain-containing protein [bacterium]